MDDKRKRNRLVEAGKNILILLLSCSAIWLSARSGLVGRLDGLLTEDDYAQLPGQTQTEGRTDFARPLRVSARLPGEVGGSCYAVQYDQEACDALFQSVAGLLVEALSSAGEPETMFRVQWEQMLTAATGVCFDFQGDMPLDVLSGWLSGEKTGLTACVRRLGLAVWKESVYLFYQEDTGAYACSRAEVVNPLHLEEVLAAFSGNGGSFAFEVEDYRHLAGDTLISGAPPSPKIYEAANPVAGGQETLETLANELGFAINTNGVYYAGEWVARSGNDTLRLSDDGEMEYLADETGGKHFLVTNMRAAADRFDAVETCRMLAATALSPRCGAARLYLMSVTATQTGWEIDFGYSLDGIPVQMEAGSAAHFVVEGDRVTQFTLRFRDYTGTETSLAALPVPQAAAALEAMGLSGEELMLVYSDGGGDTVRADWAAVSPVGKG